METKDFLKLIRARWEWMIFIATALGAGAFVYSIVQVPEYQSGARILIIQKSLQDSDAFIAARSSERLSIILSEVINSNYFFNNVLAANDKIINDFGKDPTERKDEWKRQVRNRINSDKGIMDIEVYDKSRDQAKEIIGGILKELTENGNKYHGGGNNVEIKVIDEPITSDKPVRPATAFNTAAAALLGIIGSGVLAYLFTDPELLNKKEKERMSKLVRFPKFGGSLGKSESASVIETPNGELSAKLQELKEKEAINTNGQSKDEWTF